MPVRHTHDSFDVAVVGHGIAGLSAAVRLLEGGRAPVVIEKSPRSERGGNTRFMSAIVRIPIEDPARARAELDLDWLPLAYSEDEFFEDIVEASRGRADPDLCRALAEGAYETARWLHDQGLEWREPSHTWDAAEDPGVVEVVGEGPAVVETLSSRIEALGGEFNYETDFRDLRFDERNRVCGLEAVTDEGRVAYAVDDVVLCSGGYLANPEKRARYMGAGAADVVVVGTRFNTGEPLRAAVEHGAMTTSNIGEAHTLPADANAPPVEAGGAGVRGYQYGVLLNDRGERFVDEGRGLFGSTWGWVGKAVHDQPNQRAYLVYDAAVDDDLVWSQFGSDPLEDETLAGVLEEAGVGDPATALRTVEAFNDATPGTAVEPGQLDGVATSGLQPEKSNWAAPIEAPPFRCYPIKSGTTFVYGGLKTATDGAVLDTRGKRLRGLWAAGNVTGGLLYGEHFGPIAAITGATFARAVGSALAVNPPSSP